MPICTIGTRPITIIISTTVHSRTAVERFSSIIKKAIGTARNNMKLNALRSAPCSPCIALRICASASIMVPLAISEGWKVKPKTLSTRCAPLMSSPATSTHSSVKNDAKRKRGVRSLK